MPYQIDTNVFISNVRTFQPPIGYESHFQLLHQTREHVRLSLEVGRAVRASDGVGKGMVGGRTSVSREPFADGRSAISSSETELLQGGCRGIFLIYFILLPVQENLHKFELFEGRK